MKPEIIAKLSTASKPYDMPDGSVATSISIKQLIDIARQYGTKQKDLAITALKNDIIPERYIRNMHSLSMDDQIRLLESSVCVVGLGGLGGSVMEWLARAGVGQMRLVDGDRFEHHNLNRQLLSTQHRIGSLKAEVAAERICSINSSIAVETHTEFLQSDNAARLISVELVPASYI